MCVYIVKNSQTKADAINKNNKIVLGAFNAHALVFINIKLFTTSKHALKSELNIIYNYFLVFLTLNKTYLT